MDQLSQVSDLESLAGAVMAELFESIGFQVGDEDAYNLLAEYAETSGERSQLHRGDAILHGRCWKIGEGLEVWSILYERGDDLYYADCRPAFRGRYVHKVEPWELIEYDEDGEAIIRGLSSTGTALLFELQNITQAEPGLFRDAELSIGLAGIAYSCQIHHPGARKSGESSEFRFQLSEPVGGSDVESCESDYFVCGSVLAWRELRNPVTKTSLLWLYVDTGAIRIEIVTSKRRLRGKPKIGASITANVWLQGHVLDASELWARYEGVDKESEPSDFWTRLRRTN